MALLPLALVALCSGCMTTLGGRSVPMLVSEDEEVALGVKAYAQILGSPENSGHLLTSGPEYRRVDRIARRISAVAARDKPNYQWQWTVIDDPKTVNAFCLPGGKIAVYTGILRVAADDDELAAVIGHEIAHATNRHGGKRISQKMLEGLLSEGVGELLGFEEGEKEVLMGALGTVASTFDAYSRDDETEADIVGLRYLIEAGYDPEAAVRFWEKMSKLGGGGLEILSTHPSSERRVKNLRKAIGIWRAKGNKAFSSMDPYS